jgi:hypothetical protein
VLLGVGVAAAKIADPSHPDDYLGISDLLSKVHPDHADLKLLGNGSLQFRCHLVSDGRHDHFFWRVHAEQDATKYGSAP